MKITDVKGFEKLQKLQENDYYPNPEDVAVFIKHFIPYIQHLEIKVEQMGKEIDYLQNRVAQLDNLSSY